MRTNRVFSSLRWRTVIIFVVIALIFIAMTTFTLFSIMENYIVNERINQESGDVNKVAVRVASYLESGDASSLYSILYDNASQNGGRYLVTANSGIVIADSSSLANGIKLNIDELNSIIYDNKSSDYGFHNISNNINSDNWCVYYTAGVRSGGEMIGALLYSSSIQDIVNTLDDIRYSVIWIFFISIAATFIVSLIVINIIIKPIKNLTSTAVKISSGDLSQRVQVKGSSEISEFGQTFNMMCDKLQHIDIQRSEFVSNASHELKTPLASIKILVESLLYQDNINESCYKEFLGDINSELDRMNNLVNDLLLLSKMDSDNLQLNIMMNSVDSIIEEALTALKPIIDNKKIEYSVLGVKNIDVECDRLKIFQCIYNLLSNAVKYTNEGGKIFVTLSVKGKNVHISVRDTGIGISQEELPRVFERFFRVDKARSRETGGSGLGLHIVQKIALLHHGRVTVESEEGVGSDFTLIIPFVYDNTLDSLSEEDRN